MTRSTGKRAAQQRREELFGAEMRLSRIWLHLRNARAAAVGYGAMVDARGYAAAASFVRAVLIDVMAEAEKLRSSA